MQSQLENYFDAWLQHMRQHGHNRASVDVVDILSTERIQISWCDDTARVVDTHTKETHAAWIDAINGFLLCEPERPTFIVQIPIIGEILSGDRQWPEAERIWADA